MIPATGLAIAALTIAAVVAMPALHAAHRDAQLDARCDAEAAAVRALVDAPALARARAPFAGPDRAALGAIVRRATTVLAADADRLATAAAHSCRLGPTAEYAAARAACLTDARTRIAELMTSLDAGQEVAARHAIDTAWSLASLAPCADARSVPPVSRALPAERAALIHANEQLAELGSDPAIAAPLEPIRVAALARGDYDTAREALKLIGHAFSQSQPARGDAALHDAFAAAEASGNDADAVAIAISMVQLEGDGMHDRQASARSAGLANAKLARMGGGPGTLVGPLLAAEALAATDAGDNVTAELEMRTGLAVTIATYGRSHPEVASVELALTQPLTRLGKYADAIDAAHAAIEIDRELMGPDEVSDYTAQAVLFLGQAEEAAGQLEAARADLARADEAFARLPDPSAKWVGQFDVELSLGAVALDAGSWREARDGAVRALAIARANGGVGSFGESLARLDMALDELAGGDPAAALSDATAALAIQARELGAENPQLAVAETRIARARVALHHAADAISDGERAVKLATAAGNPGDLGDAELALADALWDGGGDRRRAHDLAVAAAAAKPAPKNAAAWLASHPAP